MQFLKKHNSLVSIILPILSAILLAIAWNQYIPALSLFIAFIPMLFLFENKHLSNDFIFKISFLAFLVFHIGNVWWLYKSSIPGFLIIIVLNSFFMACVMLMSFISYKKFGRNVGLFLFVIYWISFEYIHYHWEFSWPFMNLGNWLGQIPIQIQWYEYTGVLGGTLLILIINILIYFSIKHIFEKKIKDLILTSVILFCLITVTLLFSDKLYQKNIGNNLKLKIKLIQPNIDPYTKKYNTKLFNEQITNQIVLASIDTSKTECCIFPESSFPSFVNEQRLESDSVLKLIKNKLLLKNGAILGGLYSFSLINGDTLYYNSAFMLSNNIQLYHKSKLVIGVEKMPFQSIFNFLEDWNLNFGGFTSSLNTDNDRKVFSSPDTTWQIAPVICYESIYGQFVSEFIRNGAGSIAVITNDAWWGKTPGYLQHLMHSQLRAIETRKFVSRSANTGLTCIINTKGIITSQSEEFKTNYLVGNIYQNNLNTFYTKNGDYIGEIAVFFSALVFIYQLIIFLKNKLIKL
jgi:apolipoprotein N-acyltransferase